MFQFENFWLESLYQLLAVLYFLSYSAHHSIHAASFMTLAWGLVAPVGIILAMFYKVILPNGEWFYVSVGHVSMHSVCEVVRTLISSLQASSGTATISPGPHRHHEYHPLPHDRGCYSHCGTLWWEVAHHYRKTTLKCFRS